jgi:hypothetical protein
MNDLIKIAKQTIDDLSDLAVEIPEPITQKLLNIITPLRSALYNDEGEKLLENLK